MNGGDKQALRDEVWAAIRDAGVARFPGVEGRIPNFTGAEKAAERLASTDPWRRASVVKANPDSPQWPVRALALEAGKTVYMAVPRLASSWPFWRLHPEIIDVSPREASSISGASRHGEPVRLEDLEHIDLVICGSVAVDLDGARLGKGGGYSDLEFGLGVAAGVIDAATVTATTVHPVQVVDRGRIPLTDHDFPVDLVVTPEHTHILDRTLDRPSGILWEHLGETMLDDIPALERLRPGSDG